MLSCCFAQITGQRGKTDNEIATLCRNSGRIRIRMRHAGALAILGTLEESRGDLDKAENYYRKSLQIQPQQPIAANNLAYRMLLKGEKVRHRPDPRADCPAGHA